MIFQYKLYRIYEEIDVIYDTPVNTTDVLIKSSHDENIYLWKLIVMKAQDETNGCFIKFPYKTYNAIFVCVYNYTLICGVA